jgi:hypothetical protein
MTNSALQILDMYWVPLASVIAIIVSYCLSSQTGIRRNAVAISLLAIPLCYVLPHLQAGTWYKNGYTALQNAYDQIGWFAILWLPIALEAVFAIYLKRRHLSPAIASIVLAIAGILFIYLISVSLFPLLFYLIGDTW